MTEPQDLYVKVSGQRRAIDGRVFDLLFSSSVVSGRRPITRALEEGEIAFSDLVKLAHDALIPYPLFFASYEVAEAQVKHQRAQLEKGVPNTPLLLGARGSVRLEDVQNIVKDLRRKQAFLAKRDQSLAANHITGLLRRSRSTVVEQAETLRLALGFELEVFQGFKTKKAAFNYLVRTLESNQLLVSQAQPGALPQVMPKRAKFSGLCVKHAKIPYLFIARGGNSDTSEPHGRRILTLALLVSLVAQKRFAIVEHGAHPGTPFASRSWELAEEFLMPARQVSSAYAADLLAVRRAADLFNVTPSAMVMRLQRLGLVEYEQAILYLKDLREDFESRPRQGGNKMAVVRQIQQYLGREMLKRSFALGDRGLASRGDLHQILTLNRISRAQLMDLRQLS